MHPVRLFQMAYRGKRYFIAQEGPDSWKWTVELNDFTHQSGLAKSRDSALTSVVLMVDRMIRQSPAEASVA
jgi:hypothetical protein